MKLKYKVLAIMVAVVAIFAIGTGITAGVVYTEQQTGTVNIVPVVQSPTPTANPSLGVYTDNACQHPATGIDFGQVQVGQTVTKTVWIKNTGNVLFTSVTVSSTLDASKGTFTGIAHTGDGLGPDFITPVDLTITGVASSDGAKNFTIYFYCNT